MKKFLAVTFAAVMTLGGAAAFTACGNSDQSPVLYLVPGTYLAEGTQVENTLSAEGLKKLTQADCEKIHTENVYQCSLAAGETLPVPSSSRTDKDGTPYTFNGWWTIVDATVTYFDKVPELTETTYLYADWRADLSQRKDPVVPDSSTAVTTAHYLSVVRAAAEGEDAENTEIKIPLYISGTDVSGAFDFGYGKPVQLYNDWFELCPGDEITVYTTGLNASEEPQISPIADGDKKPGITLESSSSENNDTNDYLAVVIGTVQLTYTAASAKHFRIYIKFYNDGSTMTVYMQPKD